MDLQDHRGLMDLQDPHAELTQALAAQANTRKTVAELAQGAGFADAQAIGANRNPVPVVTKDEDAPVRVFYCAKQAGLCCGMDRSCRYRTLVA
jgi:hypothetical protein